MDRMMNLALPCRDCNKNAQRTMIRCDSLDVTVSVKCVATVFLASDVIQPNGCWYCLPPLRASQAGRSLRHLGPRLKASQAGRSLRTTPGGISSLALGRSGPPSGGIHPGTRAQGIAGISASGPPSVTWSGRHQPPPQDTPLARGHGTEEGKAAQD